MIFIGRLKNLRFDLARIEGLRIDKTTKIRINCQELRAGMAKILFPLMEFVPTVEELMRNRTSKASKNKFLKTSMKEFNFEGP